MIPFLVNACLRELNDSTFCRPAKDASTAAFQTQPLTLVAAVPNPLNPIVI
jgi:hypothetical protein